MRLLHVLVAGLLFMACNNSSRSKQNNTDTSQVTETPPSIPGIPDTIFTGFGNEPFWSVYVVKESKIVFHPADGPDIEVPYVAPAGLSDSTRYRSSAGNSAIELTILKRQCSDGMSETVHPYTIVAIVNNTTYKGCGRDGK